MGKYDRPVWGGGAELFGTGGSGFGTTWSGAGGGGTGATGGELGLNYAGRGPRGYQRTDQRIYEDVCERLCEHPDIDASEIEVKVQDGEVTLTGSVDERQVKRMAEDVAANVSGVRDVHNQLRVGAPLSGQAKP